VCVGFGEVLSSRFWLCLESVGSLHSKGYYNVVFLRLIVTFNKFKSKHFACRGIPWIPSLATLVWLQGLFARLYSCVFCLFLP